MLEKPKLDDQKILDSLEKQYGISITKLEFLPLGYDPSAGVYRVETSDEQYFLKIKKGHFYEASAAIPVYLKEQKIPEILAPLPTASNTYSHHIEDFSLMLFPFIDGNNGMDLGLTDSQWLRFGRVLQQIHETQLPEPLQQVIQREAFQLNSVWLRDIHQIHANILTQHYSDPHANELAQFWKEQYEEIAKIVKRAIEISEIMQQREHDFVLCHSDIHTANLIVDTIGQLHVVDWDAPMLAPKERDLMFILGHEKEALQEHQKHFLEGYGSTQLDPYILAYYRYEWVIHEIAEFAALVFISEDVSDMTRIDAVTEFKKLFSDGDVISAAYSVDALLAP